MAADKIPQPLRAILRVTKDNKLTSEGWKSEGLSKVEKLAQYV
jgi:hypothetical protein